jgi:hypothetical protein
VEYVDRKPMKNEGREMIPYADITEIADRRFTSRLMERLIVAGLPDGELNDLVGALQAVSDPRFFGALEGRRLRQRQAGTGSRRRRLRPPRPSPRCPRRADREVTPLVARG